VGIDEIINKAKRIFSGKADDANDAQAGLADTAVGAQDTESSKLADAKIDDVAGAIEDKTPDAWRLDRRQDRRPGEENPLTCAC